MKLSAVIIAKNAEDMIGACLDSVAFCDEIVIIDGGSEDKTIEIAKKKKVNVFSVNGEDFSRQRNIGLEKAKGEWILYIDTDERITPLLREEIITCINPDLIGINNPSNEYVAYKIRRKNYYLGKHMWPKIEQLERLFQKNRLKQWYGSLHESPIIEGKVGILKGFLEHYTHQDLASMLTKTISWSNTEAQLRLEAHHPKITWWRFPRVMISSFFDSYFIQGGWKVGTAGLIESMYQAFSIFITYARLWEMQSKNQESRIKKQE